MHFDFTSYFFFIAKYVQGIKYPLIRLDTKNKDKEINFKVTKINPPVLAGFARKALYHSGNDSFGCTSFFTMHPNITNKGQLSILEEDMASYSPDQKQKLLHLNKSYQNLKKKVK